MNFSITTDENGAIVGMSASVPDVQRTTVILADQTPDEPVIVSASVPDVQHVHGANAPVLLTESELAVRREQAEREWKDKTRWTGDPGDDFCVGRKPRWTGDPGDDFHA